MAVDRTLDQAVPAALDALAEQIQALDGSALERLQGAQTLGGTAARWVARLNSLRDEVAADAVSARRVAAQLAVQGVYDGF